VAADHITQTGGPRIGHPFRIRSKSDKYTNTLLRLQRHAHLFAELRTFGSENRRPLSFWSGGRPNSVSSDDRSSPAAFFLSSASSNCGSRLHSRECTVWVWAALSPKSRDGNSLTGNL